MHVFLPCFAPNVLLPLWGPHSVGVPYVVFYHVTFSLLLVYLVRELAS